MTVARVLCRRDLKLPDAVVTHNFEDILNDPHIDTVVEAIGRRLAAVHKELEE